MFADMWLNLCCAKRQKPENKDQPVQQKEDSNKPIMDTGQPFVASPVEQKVLQSTSQELRQKLQEAQDKKQQPQYQQSQQQFQQMINRGAVKTSLEMEVEPVEGFLSLSDNKSNKINSWEALELSRQFNNNDVLGQLSQFALSKSISNNGPYPGSNQSSDQFITTGAQQQQQDPNLAQTVQLGIIEEYPRKQMIKSNSLIQLETGKIEKKRIQKEKKQQREKGTKGQSNDAQQKKEVSHAKLWDKNEDAILRQAYQDFKGNWREIAAQLPGRNMNQCSQRWRRLNPQEQNKKKWDISDDEKIIQLVKKYDKNWAEIAKHFIGKTGKQIRERYLNKLDPDINWSAWRKEEDEIILKVYKEHGPKWSIASKQLKGRPENTVKNRFYSYIRRVFLGQQNPYSVVLNNGDLNGQDNTLSIDSESSKQQPLSMDQSPSFTASSYLSSYMEEDFMEEEDDPQQEQEDQFKI